jgi:DNA repair photolyase
MAAISEAGASTVLYTALHLRPGAREWFFLWLEREHPELVGKYQALYAGGASAPKDYRRWLGAKIRPLMRRYGLNEGGDTILGSVRNTALAAARAGAETTLIQAALPPSVQLTLF